MHSILLLATILLLNADFTICDYSNHQIYPVPIYTNSQYYVFWTDYRSQPVYGLYGARIDVDGTVIDPDGKLQFADSTFSPSVAGDGSNLLVIWREGC